MLTHSGWECFHSVRPFYDNTELDLCGIREIHGELQVIAVEAKDTDLTLALFDKALNWKRWATFTYAACNTMNYPEASNLMCKASGVGVYVMGSRSPLYEISAVHTGASRDYLNTLADAARKSSKGLIAPGGAASPRKATPAHLLAETLLNAWNSVHMPMMSVTDALGHEYSHAELAAAVQILRKRRGSPIIRDSGSDWLLCSR